MKGCVEKKIQGGDVGFGRILFGLRPCPVK